MTGDELEALWSQIHAIDEQLAPYRQTEANADDLIRTALASGTHAQILAAYDHRFETRHCHWTLTHRLVEERRWLLSQLPKRQS